MEKVTSWMDTIHINGSDDAAKFLDKEIALIEADGKPGKMERTSYVMRYLFTGPDNHDLFMKYDAYFKNENLPRYIKESYERSYPLLHFLILSKANPPSCYS